MRGCTPGERAKNSVMLTLINFIKIMLLAGYITGVILFISFYVITHEYEDRYGVRDVMYVLLWPFILIYFLIQTFRR